jgi:hypothetical protein
VTLISAAFLVPAFARGIHQHLSHHTRDNAEEFFPVEEREAEAYQHAHLRVGDAQIAPVNE